MSFLLIKIRIWQFWVQIRELTSLTAPSNEICAMIQQSYYFTYYFTPNIFESFFFISICDYNVIVSHQFLNYLLFYRWIYSSNCNAIAIWSSITASVFFVVVRKIAKFKNKKRTNRLLSVEGKPSHLMEAKPSINRYFSITHLINVSKLLIFR